MVSATPEPAENSAGAALVPAPWEISARAAVRAKPQGAGTRNHYLSRPIASRDRTFSWFGGTNAPTPQFWRIRLRRPWL
jgi:hypothetical protein